MKNLPKTLFLAVKKTVFGRKNDGKWHFLGKNWTKQFFFHNCREILSLFSSSRSFSPILCYGHPYFAVARTFARQNQKCSCLLVSLTSNWPTTIRPAGLEVTTNSHLFTSKSYRRQLPIVLACRPIPRGYIPTSVHHFIFLLP